MQLKQHTVHKAYGTQMRTVFRLPLVAKAWKPIRHALVTKRASNNEWIALAGLRTLGLSSLNQTFNWIAYSDGFPELFPVPD